MLSIDGLDSAAVFQLVWDCSCCKFDDGSGNQTAIHHEKDSSRVSWRGIVECQWFFSAQCRFDDKRNREMHSEDEMKERCCEMKLKE